MCVFCFHETLWGHEQVNTFQHIQEKLIAAILDALATPANLPRHLAGDLRLLLFCLWREKRNLRFQYKGHTDKGHSPCQGIIRPTGQMQYKHYLMLW